jgi:hypothetical protein
VIRKEDGRVRWMVETGDVSTRSDRHRLDRMAERFVFEEAALSGQPLGKAWIETKRGALELAMHHAGRNGLVMPSRPRPGVRHQSVTDFFAHFGAQARCFTNCSEAGLPGKESFTTWSPFTDATFDIVAGLVEGDRIGILCIDDED